MSSGDDYASDGSQSEDFDDSYDYASSETDSSAPEVEENPILDWYRGTYSRRVDIVGDYAGNELFLIEGDSLLLHCFSDTKLDFSSGFQLLHASYLVENLLRSLFSRRCNFHVAFFDEHRELCIPRGYSVPTSVREKYLLARAAIVRHLQVNVKKTHPDIEVNCFASLRSDAFAKYMETTGLYFIMCHDGALPNINDSVGTDDKQQPSKIAFRAMIHWFLRRGYNTALVNGLEFRDTKAITTVLEGSQNAQVKESLDLPAPSKESPNALNEVQKDMERVRSEVDCELTERELLTILALKKLHGKGVLSPQSAVAFLQHTVALSQCPLSHRVLDTTEDPDNTNEFLVEFCQSARELLEGGWDKVIPPSTKCDVADLVDGRLLVACLHHDSQAMVGPRFLTLMAALKSVSGMHSSELESAKENGELGTDTGADGVTIKGDKRYAVLPFSNPTFDNHLRPIKLATDTSSNDGNSMSARIFREASHWHNWKRPLDAKAKQDQHLKTEKSKFYARRRNQRFMAEMMAYAASLTNAVGKTLDPETVITGPKSKASDATGPETRKKPAVKPSTQKVTKKPQGKGGRANVMMSIEAQKDQKQQANTQKLLKAWSTVCESYEKEPHLPTRYQKAKSFLSTLDTEEKKTTLESEVRFYMINVLVRMWIGVCQGKRQNSELGLAALIFNDVQQVLKTSSGLTKTVANCLQTVTKVLALPSLPNQEPEVDRQLAFQFVLSNPPRGLDLAIPSRPLSFQLEHCGPFFERSIDSAPDNRVPFEPDGWQRKVLDEIDANRSLLVIAPTSAGKTFISFYAMKKILESDDDSILVYVAPTKALVNQIAAEIQARFSKTYAHAGKSVWGIHTRDYRINNPTGCQVLVTVPHILQIMLLAPSNAKSWSKRVKRIIFDEVHCIGQAEDGLIWEQLLLLAPCPVIALSATIGNPDDFSSWLNSAQQAIGIDLTKISHPHRYSDLRKFVYTPPQKFHFEGLSSDPAFSRLGLDGVSEFTFVHPVASLINRSRGMPDDLTLEARDCFTLFQSMSKHSTADYPVSEDLNPAKSLPPVIRKIDIINWEKALKTTLRQWLADSASPFDAVLDDLRKPLHEIEATSQQKPSEKRGAKHGEGTDVLCTTTLPLLTKLHDQGALPAILFNYDRGMCEEICQTLMTKLKGAETKWKKTSPKWKTKLQDWETWKKMMAKKPAQAPKRKGKATEEGATKADSMREAANEEVSQWESFNPDAPVDGFHFADIKKVTPSELKEYIEELQWRGVPEWQQEALTRGIGVHHAGMNRKFRQVVEILFRKGFLRVVIATGTLALGINMPCKTVVFVGDSVFLTALNFRQAAGRAGRRGFDVLGNVVFHGVSINKISRLISSRLPDLNGHFPITTTLVLRLFSLLNDSKQAAFAVRSIDALLSQPRLYLGGDESKMSVLHHLRFSIEYLRRQQLLDTSGAPLNFAGCVSHLYFTENSSFAFHALLKDGFFHELCADIGTKTSSVLRELMLTMAHLFGRQYCRQADQEYIEEVVKRSPSLVFLPPLPTAAADILRKHNNATLQIFRAYVGTFVKQHISEPDDRLPLTSVKVGGDENIHLPHRQPTSIRSPFVALSGYDDEFESIHDLCTTTRSGVFLEEAVIPYVGLYPEESDMPLNAYLYDFFMHSNVKALSDANKIRPGDVWFVLNDFSLVLATIVTSLANFMKLSPDSDLDLGEVMGGGEAEEERKEDGVGPVNLPPELAAGGGGVGGRATTLVDRTNKEVKAVPVVAKKKTKVVDSWDDDMDDSSEEEEAAPVETEEGEQPAWAENGGLFNVYKAFRMLKDDFDEKFKKMWA